MKVVEKPWGREVWWAETQWYLGKILEVNKGHSLSLQYHREKTETLLFWSGAAEVTLGERIWTPRIGEAVTVEPGTPHRLRAVTDVVVIEVSTPHASDVVRVEDDYGRLGVHGTEPVSETKDGSLGEAHR